MHAGCATEGKVPQVSHDKRQAVRGGPAQHNWISSGGNKEEEKLLVKKQYNNQRKSKDRDAFIVPNGEDSANVHRCPPASPTSPPSEGRGQHGRKTAPA